MKKDSLWGICLWAAMISTAFLFSGCRITAYIADEKESAQNKSVIVKLSADDVSFELIKQRAQSDGKG